MALHHPGVARQRKQDIRKSTLAMIALAKGESVPKPKERKPYKRMVVKNNMREKAIEKAIILSLKSMGYVVYKTGSSGAYDYNMQFNEDGRADLEVMTKRGTIYLEVKDEKGVQSAKQKIFEQKCKENNQEYYVVRSKEQALEAVK